MPKSPPEVKSIDCTKTAGDGFARRMIRWSPSVQIFRRYWTAFLIRRRTISGSQRFWVRLVSIRTTSPTDALFNRLLEIVLANITLANMFALVGAIFFVATLLMQTMVPLRVANMAGCTFFAPFGALSGNVATCLLYLLLLPINAIRLRQMLTLVKKARVATLGDMSMEWLRPFMTERKYRRGDRLCEKGDEANEMFLTVTGKFLVTEIGVELPPGRLMGELGFLTPNKRRTATVECTEDGQVLIITYEKLLEIYFQNPQFGYYFLVLTSQRLLENIARLEAIIAQNKIAQQTATASGTS